MAGIVALLAFNRTIIELKLKVRDKMENFKQLLIGLS